MCVSGGEGNQAFEANEYQLEGKKLLARDSQSKG